MQIDQIASLTALQGWTGLMPDPVTGALFTSPTTSVFGPPAQVSIGDSVPAFAGFNDYTQLGASGTWQFDVQSVLNPTASPVAQMARSPDQKKADDAAVKQALDYTNGGQYVAARDVLNKLLSENPTEAAGVQALGNVELADGKYDQAEQLFLKANALDPTAGYDKDAANARVLRGDDATVLKTASAMVKAKDQRDDGIRILIALTSRSPDNVEAHLVLGDALLDTGDGNNGLMQYSTALLSAQGAQLDTIAQRLAAMADETPKSAFVRQLLGKAQLQQGHFDEALQSLTAAADLADDKVVYNTEIAKAYVGIGREKLQGGDLSGAIFSFEQAKDLSPTDKTVAAALAEGYVQRAGQNADRGDSKSALADYQRVADLLGATGDTTLQPRAADSAYALGLRLQRQRIAAGADIDSEVAAFQAAYDLNPDNTTYKRKLADARSALGDQYAADGELKDAAYAYQRAAQLFKYDTTYKQKTIDAFTAYADDRLANMNFTDAINMYQEAFKLDPQNATSKSKLAGAYNARGLDYKSTEDMDAAVKDFKAALRLFPDNADYQANYNSVKAWDQ